MALNQKLFIYVYTSGKFSGSDYRRNINFGDLWQIRLSRIKKNFFREINNSSFI